MNINHNLSWWTPSFFLWNGVSLQNRLNRAYESFSSSRWQWLKQTSAKLLTFQYYALVAFVMYGMVFYYRHNQLVKLSQLNTSSYLLSTSWSNALKNLASSPKSSTVNDDLFLELNYSIQIKNSSLFLNVNKFVYNLIYLTFPHNLHLNSLQEFYHFMDHLLQILLIVFKMDFWVSLNAGYCIMNIFGKIIQKVVFGKLRTSEQIHLKDKLCNFIFYKFIFIFGVINVQYVEEVTWWTTWFAITLFIHAYSLLLQERMDYLSCSPSVSFAVKAKLWALLLTILVWTGSIFVALTLAYVKLDMLGLGVYTFMIAECFLLQLKALHILYNAIINVYESRHQGCWELKNLFAYYGDLVFSITILLVDLVYHLEMLLWSNILLSMASLVICMQIRWLFNEIKFRLRRHKNYLAVMRQMEKNYPMATPEEIEKYDNNCSICWERMKCARKLPCNHLFHNACLRSWLEHDSSCPTCRRSLHHHVVDQPLSGATPLSNFTTPATPQTRRPLHGPRLPTFIGLMRYAENMTQATTGPVLPARRGAQGVFAGYLNRLADGLYDLNHRVVAYVLEPAFSAPPIASLPTDVVGSDGRGREEIGGPTFSPATGLGVGERQISTDDPSPSIPSQASGNRINHFFHFDASRYVSWLPSFSLQVSHLRIQPLTALPSDSNRFHGGQSSLSSSGSMTLYDSAPSTLNTSLNAVNTQILDEMVSTVSHLFPYLSLPAIRRDLEVTWSPDRTAENILEGRLPDHASDIGFGEGPRFLSLEPNAAPSSPPLVDDNVFDNCPGDLIDKRVDSPQNPTVTNPLSKETCCDKSPFISYCGRFSKDSKEREKILADRKEEMLQQARRRFVKSKDGANDSHTYISQ